MTKDTKDQFQKAAQQHRKEEQTPIRDKDGTAPFPKPEFSRYPAPNLAPPGQSGTKRNLPTPAHEKAPRFSVKGPGSLKKEFKTLAAQQKNKGHDIEY